jgi:hypothetical protein
LRLDIAEASAEAGQGHVISLGSGGGGGGGGREGFRNKAGPLTEQGAGSAGGGGEGGRGGGREVVLLQGSHPAAAGYFFYCLKGRLTRFRQLGGLGSTFRLGYLAKTIVI